MTRTVWVQQMGFLAAVDIPIEGPVVLGVISEIGMYWSIERLVIVITHAFQNGKFIN